MELLSFSYCDSPCGKLILGSFRQRLCICHWADCFPVEYWEQWIGKYARVELELAENTVLNEASNQLTEYFNGIRKNFQLPLWFLGTDFQQTVWNSLRQIPYGSVISYSQQAQSIGRPLAVRAVANANSRNPIGIIVPCHRVIGAAGSMRGYADGIERKAFLLDLEGVKRISL